MVIHKVLMVGYGSRYRQYICLGLLICFIFHFNSMKITIGSQWNGTWTNWLSRICTVSFFSEFRKNPRKTYLISTFQTHQQRQPTIVAINHSYTCGAFRETIVWWFFASSKITFTIVLLRNRIQFTFHTDFNLVFM